MARLMEHVRLPLLPREYLVQVKVFEEHISMHQQHVTGATVCRFPLHSGNWA